MSLTQEILDGHFDADLKDVAEAVKIRSQNLAPWAALSELCSLHKHIQEIAAYPVAEKAEFAAPAFQDIKKRFMTHPSEIVVAAARLLQRDILIQLLNVDPDRVNTWLAKEVLDGVSQ